jgi:nucleoside-diphosphate-sugar epimerase
MSAADITPFPNRLEALDMRVFLTGATGFIGSAVAVELVEAGHEVVGLARSDRAAATLERAGARVHRGALDDLDSLRSGADAADGVIHTAFVHDFSQMEAAGRTDLRAVEALGSALAGSGRPLVVTSGTGLVAPGRVATEQDAARPSHRSASEQAALRLAAHGVRTSIVRPAPSVHGEGDHGFVPMLIDIARAKGASAYVGDGSNRWPAVHRLDIARLYRLALESAKPGSVFHGVGEEAVPTRQIAEIIGRHLDVPVVSVSSDAAGAHFGFLAAFFGADIPASSALTQQRLGWHPTHPGLLADLDAGHYFRQPAAAAA